VKLKIVSYNVKFSSFIFDDDIERVVQKLDADILCLQEFPLAKFRYWRRVLDRLGYRDSLHQKTCETLLGITQSNVIFSKFPLEDKHSVNLTYKDHEPRKAQYCLADIGDEQVFVLHTHLGLRRQERLFQMDRIVDILKNHQDIDRMILLGDFNDWNNAGEQRLGSVFKEAHEILHGRSAKTFPARMPLVRLDRIYFRNLRPVTCHALKGRYIRRKSDHLPLRACFEF
ncbi:MAG: endonuclease/exonuclease/phosphatase family protein, partial [Bacteriovoracaceae bacterium]|nr:endonuclease/exonuclease/phosphatase family protein [Bacteriovoracaceae bacterium]